MDKRAGLFLPAIIITMALIVCGCTSGIPEAKAVDTNDTGMKTIGVIGGISWVSSAEYYTLMNEMVAEELGGLHSADILMYSIEFGEVSEQERLASEGDWEPIREAMVDAAKRLEKGGADFIIICSNTMHSTVDDIEANVDIPVLHIADATGEKIKEQGLSKVGLLGTKYTMEEDFYGDRLMEKYGIEVIVPNETEREIVNDVIFDELCAGNISDVSREKYVRIIEHLEEQGAEGVILGCTEIPLLVKQDDVDIPVFDTMTIHARAAVDYALGKT